MKRRNGLLAILAGALLAGGLVTSQASAMVTCYKYLSWGVGHNVSCTESVSEDVPTRVRGAVAGSTASNGVRMVAAQMTSFTQGTYPWPRYGRVRAQGLTSSGNLISGCDSGWDYTVNGDSTYDNTGCHNARRVKSLARISLTTTSD